MKGIKGFIIAGAIIFGIGLIAIVVVLLQPGFSYDSSKYPVKETINNYGEILNLYYEGDVEGLVIESTTGDNTVITYDSEVMWYEVNYNETTKSINIIQKTKKFGFSIGNGRNDKPVVVKINGNLEKLVVDIDAASLEVKDLTINSVNINVDAGKASFENTIISKGKMDIDAGKVEFEGKILSSLDASVDAGSIELELNQSESEFTVNGRGNGSIRLEIDVDAGDYDIDYLD